MLRETNFEKKVGIEISNPASMFQKVDIIAAINSILDQSKQNAVCIPIKNLRGQIFNYEIISNTCFKTQ